jgi:hypothetical protein
LGDLKEWVLRSVTKNDSTRNSEYDLAEIDQIKKEQNFWNKPIPDLT